MKHLKLFLMMLVSLAGIQYSYGITQEDPVAVDRFYFGCTPEDNDAFDQQWTVLMLDNQDSNRTWDRFFSRGYLYCTCNLYEESNDFLITPKISLTAGKQHYLKINLIADSQQRIIFTMGKNKTAEAQNIVLLDSTFNNVSGYLTIKLPENASGDNYFGFNYRGAPWSGQIRIYSIFLTENAGADFKGVVTNDKDMTLVGAKVSMSGESYKEMTIDTDKDGKFLFNSLDPGDYKLKITADGNVSHEETITIGTTAVDHPVVLTGLVEFDVKGCVKSEEDTPVKSAVVTLKGELNYSGVTDENGNFMLEKVREFRGYELKIEKDLKVTHIDTIDVYGAEVDFGNIVMQTRVSAPYKVIAQEVDEGAVLSWTLPLKANEIRYDSGIHYGSYTMSDGTGYSVIGVAFDAPALANGVSWMANTDDELIDVYVFDINKDGSLSNRILHSAKGIKNVSYKYVWNNYEFPEEIVAPYGCVVAFSGKKLEVMMDGGNDEGYLKAYKNCQAEDYRNGLYFFDMIIGNLFIRLSGSPLGLPQLAPGVNTETVNCFKSTANSAMFKAPATGEVTYKAWRFETKDKASQDQWTSLELTDQKNLNFMDRSYKQLPQGVYQYAVQVIYGDGQESAIGYSNELEHKIYANATINITTDVGTSYADGATATLVEAQNEILTYTTTVSGGSAKFDHIRKGSYYLNISKRNFKDKSTDVLYLGSENNHVGEVFILELDNTSPFNLKTEQRDMDVTFSWNSEEGIFEDFEDMEDFVVNPAGKLGWTYFDGDKSTTGGVAMCQNTPYPNMFAKMAYMSFNPSNTTPDLLDFLKPHSGDKVLVSVTAEDAQNDDYLFSPELSFENDFVLSFFAKSGFFALSGNEEFMVGYCKDSATPDNVTWLTSKPENVGSAWREFIYDIPKDAKFITIRNVSDQKFFFILDDIYIGYKKSLADELANYEVYLDDEFVKKTNHSEVTFPNLTKGKHMAKVQTVYTLTGGSKVYSDFVEHLFTVTPSTGIEGQTLENLYTYDPNGIITFNEATGIRAYNVQGQLVEISKDTQMNVSNWESGLYIFQVKVNNDTIYYKIFVK